MVVDVAVERLCFANLALLVLGSWVVHVTILEVACGEVTMFEITGGVVSRARGNVFLKHHHTKWIQKEKSPFKGILLFNTEIAKRKFRIFGMGDSVSSSDGNPCRRVAACRPAEMAVQ